MIKNILLHLHLINKHRFKVFKLCLKAGVPFRGLVHDLSKYSKEEFFEGVKYYSGDKSPIVNAKMDQGYSRAWLHHKGRNKHHIEYWVDAYGPETRVIIPYEYTVEMICDRIAALHTYKGLVTNDIYLNDYLNDKRRDLINPLIDQVLIEVYKEISIKGIDSVINAKTLKKIYNRYVDRKED